MNTILHYISMVFDEVVFSDILYMRARATKKRCRTCPGEMLLNSSSSLIDDRNVPSQFIIIKTRRAWVLIMRVYDDQHRAWSSVHNEFILFPPQQPINARGKRLTFDNLNKMITINIILLAPSSEHHLYT